MLRASALSQAKMPDLSFRLQQPSIALRIAHMSQDTVREVAVKRPRRFAPDDYITFGLAISLTVLFCGITVANWPGHLLRTFPIVHENFRGVPLAMR